jgi:hypothetical protein
VGNPLALFPVRLETRFDLGKAVLHVRVYPDEFFSDIHERELTPDERDAGNVYWNNQSASDEQTDPKFVDRWTALAKRYGVPRAAYIVRVMTPPVANQPTLRATVPSRGAEAVLPDRWVALAYKNGELRHFVPGLPIPEPLDLTANPSADDQTLSEVADGFDVPSNILWTMRYDVALGNGMAIDIGGLAPDELSGGFDRVIVVGVKTSMDPADSSQLISDLFDAHHFTRGLDLVPLGTPTNNIPGQPTPFTMKDPPGAESFQIERVGPGGQENSFTADYQVLSEVFGFSETTGPFTFLAASLNGQHDIFTGADMRRVVWPATLGYFLRQMMNPPNGTPIFNETTFHAAKTFFLEYVSAQGPAPALRVGAVPYGVLPAISYSRMTAQSGENSDAMAVIQKLVPFWLNAVPTVLTVPRNSSDRNTDLMNVLSQKSSADGVFIRNSFGPDTITNILQFIFEDFAAIYAALAQIPNTSLGALGHTDWAKARIFEILFSATTALYGGPLVTAHPTQGMLVTAIAQPDPTKPTQALNYLSFLGDTRLDFSSVAGQGSMLNAAPPNELLPLLFLVARHSLLLEAIEVGRASSVLSSAFSKLRVADVELWRILSTSETDIIDILGGPSPSTSRPVFQSVVLNSDGKTAVDTGIPPVFSQLQSAAQRLGFLSVNELERVFTETLDLAAHRLDAYVTALATRRLLTLREEIVVGLRANVVAADEATNLLTYFGGYGIVEDVRPVARTTRTVNGVTFDVQLDSGGYIHAPSPRHATAAAILRSGRMAERSDPTKYAIELPSDRARRARLLVDGVRNGQPLGELLGFELESNLRARAQTQQITGMEGYILALRQLYPLVANKSGLDPGQPADGIAAANVVDGQKVRDGRSKPGGIPFGTGGLPAKNSPAGQAITDEVNGLDEVVDSVGDLEISEAVFQVAAGDVASAEAAMNFLPTGSNPPQSEVTNSPTAGIPVSHRVALLLEGNAPTATGWTLVGSPSGTSRSVRGLADAFVEAWVGSLLGNPSGATASVSFQLGGNPGTSHVSVADINTIGPLDFLALAQSTSAFGQGSPLDRQLAAAWLALPGNVGATDVVVTGYDTPTAGPSIPQLIELARALGSVLGGARELAAADFVRTPDDVQDGDLAGLAGPLKLKAAGAFTGLNSALNAFDNVDARTALSLAALYQADAFPDPGATEADLGPQVMSAKGELGRRVSDAEAAAPATDASNADTIAAAINQFRIIFGRNTLVVLPAAIPPGSGELQQSIVALDSPLDLSNPDPSLDLTKAATFAPHQAPGRYLQQASRVHERLAAWRKFSLYAGAFGTPLPRVFAAQLPFVENEQWVGRVAPTDSRTSLLFISGNGQTAHPDATQVWRGLLLDQWTELVPGPTAETGLAFHYDSQNSEAPNVILMAMHSGQTTTWNLAELAAIVSETMDLALIRPVDSDRVGLGQLVPPICLASNSTNRIVSTNIGPEARENVPIVVT